mgnify:CR=1 FL=1
MPQLAEAVKLPPGAIAALTSIGLKNKDREAAPIINFLFFIRISFFLFYCVIFFIFNISFFIKE